MGGVPRELRIPAKKENRFISVDGNADVASISNAPGYRYRYRTVFYGYGSGPQPLGFFAQQSKTENISATPPVVSEQNIIVVTRLCRIRSRCLTLI
jgi:hypothetical protein